MCLMFFYNLPLLKYTELRNNFYICHEIFITKLQKIILILLLEVYVAYVYVYFSRES
ncbi:unnamed protein product [Meloidogyne enterolobii]|uniref:Uncharacterized protein n=1 Tax=Meloidogyne enterolobii TaxID=390850 RepID=A0ACB0XPR8_MELEN